MGRPTVLFALALAACDGGTVPMPDAGMVDPEVDSGMIEDEDAGMVVEPEVVVFESFSEADGPVLNPDVGFYEWHPRSTAGLVFFHRDLDEYCATADLPSAYIASVNDELDVLRQSGQRAVIRFRYSHTSDNNPCGRTDAMSIEIVEGHIAQLASVFEANADVIAYVEAGFLGKWGEWNSEDAPAGTALVESEDNRRRVVLALVDAVPPSRTILLRRPRFRAEIEDDVVAADLARIGFHNDCYLASSSDYGTYDGDRTPDEWRSYIASSGAPMGGETCIDTVEFTNCENALADLERLRFSYLNIGYQALVIDRWRDEGCFPEIERRLGHRLVMRRAEVSISDRIEVEMSIENVGFAAAYGARRPSLCLFRDGACTALETEGDGVEGIAPAATATITAGADLPAELSGEYELRIVYFDAESDDPAYALLFANEERDDTRRENVIGTITIE